MSRAPAPIRIRDAVAADAAQLAALLTELGYPADVAFAAERIAHFAADAASRAIVADEDTAVVGLVATHALPRMDADRCSLRIVDLIVAASRRRRGVASALLDAAEAEAARQGATRIDLSSGDWREDAHAFYAHAGFERRSQGFTKRLV